MSRPANASQRRAIRERVLWACILTALIDGDASRAEGELLARFAAALQLKSGALATAQRLIDEQLLIARIDVVRRSFIGPRGRAYLAHHGGARLRARTVRALIGVPDRALAARYQALEELRRAYDIEPRSAG